MPDPRQDLAVGGPLLERAKRNLKLLAIRILRLPLRLLTSQLREELMSLRAAAVESLAYVGVELRRLGDLVEHGETPTRPPATGAAANGEAATLVEAPFAFRSLAGVDAPGPVLVAGSTGRELGRSLSSLGYEVTLVEGRLEDLDADGGRFQAVLYMGGPEQPASGELARINDLLADGGVLVMSVAFGLSGANGYDEDVLDELLAEWAVADRMVVASIPGRGWEPVRNGSTPERGIALVAARRAVPTG